uniref:TDP43_N domain-containing protein n=1 Tax=Parastrongyloides trichosuri TaxID=131310 RepID=A0A0N4Z078_PARTI
MSSHIENISRRVLQIHVEPIEIELNDVDDEILLPTLRTAFPHCTGLYYHDYKTNAKNIVKFDGKKFLPPKGDWLSQTIYANLSGGKMLYEVNNNYENATKTFERSVYAVQKMFESFNGNIKRKDIIMENGNKSKENIKSKDKSSPLDNMEPLLLKLSQKMNQKKFKENNSSGNGEITKEKEEEGSEMNNEKNFEKMNNLSYSQMEQQFLDLAKISTGKDSIIESQRKELAEANKRIPLLEREISELNDKLEKANEKCKDYENELDVFKEIADLQEDYQDKLNFIEKMLTSSEKQIRVLETKLEKETNEKEMFKKELDKTSNKFTELEYLINNLNGERLCLKEELNETCNQLTIKCKELNALNEELTIDNISLLEREHNAIAKLESITTKHYNDYRNYNNIIQSNNDQIEELEKTIKSLEATLTQLLQANNDLSRRLDFNESLITP